ncbi:MAG: hypothetical protein NVSMB14_09040 [Isosphaeraceae bacterium]
MTSRKDGSKESRREILFETQSRSKEFSPAVRKSVEEYLRDTPPSPLSPMTKGILIALAVIVGILFIVTLVVGVARPKSKSSQADAPRTTFSVDFASRRRIV